MLREIPGVTQADEKWHEGNTAAATAYIYVGWNMVKERARQELLLTAIISYEHLLFICSVRLRGVFRVEQNAELTCQSYQKILHWM